MSLQQDVVADEGFFAQVWYLSRKKLALSLSLFLASLSFFLLGFVFPFVPVFSVSSIQSSSFVSLLYDSPRHFQIFSLSIINKRH